MKRLRYTGFVLAGLSLVLLSCSTEHEPSSAVSGGVPAEIEVTVMDMEPAGAPRSRANFDPTDDYQTVRSFGSGDRIGILATGGLVGEDGESHWIKNEYMENYQATGSSTYKFRNDNLIINTAMMGGKVGKYVYYPYTDEMPIPRYDKNDFSTSTGNVTMSGEHRYWYANPNNKEAKKDGKEVGTYDLTVPDYDKKNGLLLREKKKKRDANGNLTNTDEDFFRCVDYMYISSISLTNGALGGGFYHGFSEMIILRGEGFNGKNKDGSVIEDCWYNDPETSEDAKNDISVVLSAGYTRLTLSLFLNNDTGVYSWRPHLWFVAGDNGFTSADEAKSWHAWRGADYIDSNEGLPDPREAWYVILPTAHSYSYPIAEYIKLRDNDGTEWSVSNFELYVDPTTGIADKQMRPGKRYAVEVMMTELGATARPVEIADWIEKDENPGEQDSHNITDIRKVGITESNVDYWAGAYNKFILDHSTWDSRPSTEEQLNTTEYATLRNCGNYDLEKRLWTFFITDDITLTNDNIQITDLQDEIEGASSSANYTITNLSYTFFDKISERGSVKNLDFNNLYVKPGTSSYTADTYYAAGALTNLLDGGKIENCNINDGTVVGATTTDPRKHTVGMLCGSVKSGIVKGCTVTGAIIGYTFGDDDYPAGLFGHVDTEGGTFVNDENKADGLIIKSYD